MSYKALQEQLALKQLPPDTPLLLEAPARARWKNGKIEVENALFPQVSVEGTWNKVNSPSYRYPVLVTDEGLFVNPIWRIFAQAFAEGHLPMSSEKGERPLGFFLAAISNKRTTFSTHCPCLDGHKSVASLTMQACSFALRDYGQEEFERTQEKLADWVRKTSLMELEAMEEPQATLLDVAMQYQLWEVAEALWNKGIRWSAHGLKTGQPLADLVVGSNALRSTISSFLGYWANDTIEQRTLACQEWLQEWQARWASQGHPLPEDAAISWRVEKWKKNGYSISEEKKDTPLSLWASELTVVNGSKVVSYDQTSEHMKAVFHQWVRFWTEQGADLEKLTLFKAVQNEPPIPFQDYWSSTNWAELAISMSREIRLENVLSAGAIGGSKFRL